MSAEREVMLSKEPVELYKILKFEGLAASGGEAKNLIADSQVRVNGKVETRKRRKMLGGDLIEYMGEKIRLKFSLNPPAAL